VALDAPRSIGILGGTFNPPHLGHVALARNAREELGLERVLLMPAHSAPYKPEEPDPGPEHRMRMCDLAVEGTAGLSACALEIDRGGPSYTVDTLRAIHDERCPGAELTFIVGADTARTLPDWREPEGVLELASLAVAEREGLGREEVLGALAALTRAHGGPAGVVFLGMPEMEISSSMVRARVAREERIEDLVGARVASYIAEHGLYREPARTGALLMRKDGCKRR
jgi:nicotinate-nucleotide adenylyltransferase